MLALALTIYLGFFQEYNDAIPLELRILAEEYRKRPQQTIPDGTYSGFLVYNEIPYKIIYEFYGNKASKSVITGYGTEDAVTSKAITSFQIEGSVIIFDKEEKGIFISIPRPFEIYDDKLRFPGNMEISDFIKVSTHTNLEDQS